MLIAMPSYPLSPDPADVKAVMDADHANLMFGDVHVRGRYPGYALRYFRDNDIELDITDSGSGNPDLLHRRLRILLVLHEHWVSWRRVGVRWSR